MAPHEHFIGQPINRVEGLDKVIGRAKYAADYRFDHMAYGSVVTSTVTKGRIRSIDTRSALQAPGVLSVLSHLNAPPVPGYLHSSTSATPVFAGAEFKPFLDDRIHFNSQPVALVIAATIAQAEHAASLVRVEYETQDHQTDIHDNLSAAVIPPRSADYTRGLPEAWKNAPVHVEAEYQTPWQVHNPIEPHATTAYWEGDDKLFIFNKSQGVKTTRQQFANYFKLKEENVKVLSPFVGGAFGSSSRMWPQEMMAVMGAKIVGRPVQVALQRTQVFNMVGYRPRSIQKYAIGAQTDGTLVGISHLAWGNTSRYEQFSERILDPTKSMYACPNVHTEYKLVPLDMSTPCPTRGPGETSGSFAMESAMDELAYALNMDPLSLRKKNFNADDPMKQLPWSSNYLQECYDRGAAKFGWEKRNPSPRSMRNGEMLVGWGMSAGIYKAERAPASASITMKADGQAVIRCSVADTGPGSITIMTQIAADVLDLSPEQVKIAWADADFPMAPPQYGSHTTASTGSAVYDAASALKKKFIDLEAVSVQARAIDYPGILQKHGLTELEATAGSKPEPELEKYSGKSFSVHFVEVEVHPLTGQVRVTRVLTAIDAGRVMNHKTAHSQVLGAVTWGIGIALMEQGLIDHRYGRYINNNLADYHVPVHSDMPDIDVFFVDKPDPVLDPMGAKGLGEVGLIGLTAGIANAVFHATGKRIRELPITPDKLIS
ncbi:MAG: xanthine dehydrogenase family protein molybdopterin-binding subunit [Bacteroidota bacterium]|nr:xanthine dehydrogenase family protein molybdopterin-binding subunit [Bacteroidota bacterium]